MPIPVTVTNPEGQGLKVQSAQALPTDGPFARIAALKAQQQEQEQHAAEQQQAHGHAQEQPCGPASGAAAAAAAASAPAASTSSIGPPQYSLVVSGLNFSYPGLDGRPVPGIPPLLNNLSFQLPRGACCLLLGANGAGKTTFLKILGGKHLVPEGAVRVLERSPFHDTQLTVSGQLAYVGGNWTRDIAFAGCSVPLTGDFPAQKMIDAIPGVDPARKARLIKVLDIDPSWRMHQVSDGQRRRVQICVGLLKPFDVLLLDEITVDLDVLGRSELLAFLRDECATRGATVLYATHIFDGLESWPTHIAYLARGDMVMFKEAKDIPELSQGRLLEMVYQLLCTEDERLLKERGPRSVEWDPSREGQVGEFSYAFNNGWVPGTMNTSLSTNAVMRT